MAETEERTLRISSTTLATALALIGLYTLDLVRCAFLVDAPDPSALADPGPSAYFARILFCAGAAPFVGGAIWLRTKGREAALFATLSRSLVPAVIASALAAIVLS
jgi:hypothetical protein